MQGRLQVGEAKPWLGHPPLSRATDPNARRVMEVFADVKFSSVFASVNWKISVFVSLIPTIRVTPMFELKPTAITWLCVFFPA